MHTRGGQRQHHVARTNRFAVDDALLVHNADGEARKVVVVLRHHAGMLRRFTADERGFRLHAAFRHARDDGRDFLRHILAAGDIIKEEQRLRAAANHVVDAHRHAVNADGIMLVKQHGDFQLRANAIRAGNEHRLFHARRVQRKQAAEAADALDTARRHRPRDMLLHQFHRRVTGGNVNTRCLVAFALALHHGCLLLCRIRRVSRRPAPCRREWAGRICFSPSPAADQPDICRRSSLCRIRSGCPPPACRTPPGTKSRWSPRR